MADAVGLARLGVEVVFINAPEYRRLRVGLSAEGGVSHTRQA